MKCSRCKTDFCYKCGKAFNWTLAYRLLVGDHYDKYSIVGCPTLLYPHSKVKRTSVRTLVYTAKKLALLPFVVVIGAMIIALIPFILISFVPVILFMTSAKLCCKSQTTDNVVPA
ncbi:E3 ubiquitin-protein ligase RNF217-like isoform X2 [Convolutriloba macropyga]|uniref:E3 ubiquitin-protein ligase RNF217-like isoform X1 n=1 Tax=Convolutriloba macropyga TaxID=536237 RepID=UPI003F5247ED